MKIKANCSNLVLTILGSRVMFLLICLLNHNRNEHEITCPYTSTRYTDTCWPTSSLNQCHCGRQTALPATALESATQSLCAMVPLPRDSDISNVCCRGVTISRRHSRNQCISACKANARPCWQKRANIYVIPIFVPAHGRTRFGSGGQHPRDCQRKQIV